MQMRRSTQIAVLLVDLFRLFFAVFCILRKMIEIKQKFGKKS